MLDFDYFLENYDHIVENAVDTGDELTNVENYDRVSTYLDSALWNDHREDVSIYFYGSRMYGLASDDSDLDIFVDVKDGNGKNLTF
jgi:hypothetical protein